MKKFSFSVFSVFLAAFTVQAADFSVWDYSCRLKLNTSSTGAGISGPVANFPVLVRLSSTNFDFAQTKDDGSDLRFSKDELTSHATELSYQIERWDKTGKMAEIWVKVPSIAGNNSSQAIKMYWGNPAAATYYPAEPVFSSTNGYAGVWHLGENPGSANGGFKDVTPDGNNGTGVNGTSSVAAISGNGVNFNGGQSITIPDLVSGMPSTLHQAGSLTIDVWVNATAQGQYKRIIDKPFSNATAPWDEFDIQSGTASNTYAFVLGIGTAQTSVTSTSATSIGQWYHVVGTYDQSSMKIYVNGVLEASKAQTGVIADYMQGLTFGKYGMDNVSNFNGKIDEVRISSEARSADWIKLSYMNQRVDQKLVEMQPTNLFAGPSGILFQKYDGISNGNDVTTFLVVPDFPENPTATRILPSLNWKRITPSNPQLATDDVTLGSLTNYGVRMSGWIQPPVTANYTFQLLADDRGELWLSSDAVPANKTRIITVMNDWRGPDAWGQAPQQKSVAINLKAGHLYYIEGLLTQAGGDANLGVGWSWTNAAGTVVTENPALPSRFFLSPNEEDPAYPSTISLYQKGTANKKATLGWDNSTGNEHFYLETDGKFRIDETGVTTTGQVHSDVLQADTRLSVFPPQIGNVPHGSSTITYDGLSVGLSSIPGQTLIEAKLGTTGLDYKVTNTQNNTFSETKITDAGISTSGYVMTKKWKVPTPDYVFEPGYKLPTLDSAEKFIKQNRHLPGMLSGKEMEEQGVDIATMNMQLLKQVEHLHLYMMEQNTRLRDQQTLLEKQQKRLDALEHSKR